MYQERPPSAAETFQRLVGEVAATMHPLRADALPFSVDQAAPRERSAPGRTAVTGPGDSIVQFRDIFSSPENQIFKVVFFPDRIFHAQYLNASRAPERYRYAVSDARSVLDVSVLKAQVFLDGRKLSNLIRIEYRASRLVEMTRESGRFLREEVIAWIRVRGKALARDVHGRVLDENGQVYDPASGLEPKREAMTEELPVKMHFCPWINAYQVEIWETLEPPTRETRHHFQVLAQMGPTGSITRVRKFSPILELLDDLSAVEMAFRENDVDAPFGKAIKDPRWDNNYERNYQDPRSALPSDNATNTVPVGNYFVSFQKGWFIDANNVAPVRYRNAMMDASNPDYVDPNKYPQWGDPKAWQGQPPAQAFAEANVIEMRWLLQREFGGSVVFFHEVTIPPGTVEGTHCHVGSEELYYIVSGEGVAYMAVGDDPKTMERDPDTGAPRFPVVERHVYGLFPRECVELPVKPGSVIFTKSGGVHGIKNLGQVPLKFVAFLYHSV